MHAVLRKEIIIGVIDGVSAQNPSPGDRVLMHKEANVTSLIGWTIRAARALLVAASSQKSRTFLEAVVGAPYCSARTSSLFCPHTMDHPALIDYLRRHRLIEAGDVTVELMDGGVSGDVWLVRTDGRAFVVKRALDKLRVRDEWLCNAGRNLNEYRAIEYVGTILPQSVPQLLHVDADQNLFAMEYFGNDFVNWKQQLLKGEVSTASARRAAEFLATIHNRTWLSSNVERLFETGNSFYALRIEPYLITTGRRHSKLQSLFESEASRLASTNIALTHGDFSAKNILISGSRQVYLDWEVAWYGDPAFDSAFLLNLLLLKSLYLRAQCDKFVQLIAEFRQTYASALNRFDVELDRRIVRLTLLLLLARIDGKSPAEYITDENQRAFVRSFVTRMLLGHEATFDQLVSKWGMGVSTLC